MADHVREVATTYHTDVTLKREALKQYDVLNDKFQDKFIELVEKETLLS